MWDMVVDCVLQPSAGDHHTCVDQGTDAVKKPIVLPIARICDVTGSVFEVDIAVGCGGIVHVEGGWVIICVEFVNRVIVEANKANVCGNWGEPNRFEHVNSIEVCNTIG